MRFLALFAFFLAQGFKEAKGDCSGRKHDIAILGDISRSLKPADLRKMRRAIISIVNKLGVSKEGNHFGVIAFGPAATLANKFNYQKYQNKTVLTRLVSQKFKKIAKKWGTRIDKALKLALYQLFTPAGGDRPNAADIVFIFTDGKPTGRQANDFTPFKQLTDGLQTASGKLINNSNGSALSVLLSTTIFVITVVDKTADNT